LRAFKLLTLASTVLLAAACRDETVRTVGPDVETIQNRSLNTGTTEAEDPLVLPGEEEFVRLDRE
jgi:hypothetical protein